jgi:hypothetical protein
MTIRHMRVGVRIGERAGLNVDRCVLTFTCIFVRVMGCG